MIYAEVSDPLLQQDYYRGITAIDPNSANLTQPELEPSQQEQLRRLLVELKTHNLEPTRQQEIVDQMQRLIDEPEKTAA
jgi:hypothetical protein